MTHQPPVPEAQQSPYPLHPAPHDESVAKVVVPTRKKDAPEGTALPLVELIGIGAALLGAAAAAIYYFRRGATPAPARTARKSPSSDRKLVAAKQPYEVTYFARKHGITAKQARAILTEAGPSRAKANALAAERKG